MDDTLKPWDFCKEFTISESASLMLGLRPDMTTSSGGSLEPIEKRMMDDYRRVKTEVFMRVRAVEHGKSPDLSELGSGALKCTLCEEAIKDLVHTKEERDNCDGFYVSSKEVRTEWNDGPKFRREVISDWIKANGFESKYDFSDPKTRKAAVPKAGEVSTKERNSMLAIIIAMAVRGYTYNPEASKNNAVADIASDMHELGMKMDDDTIRRYLKEAKHLLPSNATKPNSG